MNYRTAARIAGSITCMGKAPIGIYRAAELLALHSGSSKPGCRVRPQTPTQTKAYTVQLGMDGIREARKIYGE